ncbi:ABC transporter ATP-binding protein [Bacillus carboniphilus]|uniref:ABC transporter ATP-binding protein n=1 Tax=Bacillus carboniphilus TaxID=86663 RepID=A0ABN0W862_9BACI
MNQLEVKDLHVGFEEKKGYKSIINGITFTVREGETLCIVGESGCGKSLTSLSVMGLLPGLGKITNGHILFNGDDLSKKNQKELSRIRGNEISMIFQEPMTSLNPVHTVGKQISEAIRIHQKVTKKEATEKAIEMLRLVGIPSPETRIKSYPHEMSGGMRQRVMIAMALVCKPKLLIADEPTTALDVTIQAQILELMGNLKEEFGMSIMMITHDLGVVSEVADRVLVMYAGEVVEMSDAKDLFKHPKHPYTKGLIRSLPTLGDDEQEELPTIKGSVPSPDNMPEGCRFSTRCPFAKEECFTVKPELYEEGKGTVRCWMYSDKWEQMQGGSTDDPAIGEAVSATT